MNLARAGRAAAAAMRFMQLSSLLRDPQAAAWLMRHHLKMLPGVPWLEVS